MQSEMGGLGNGGQERDGESGCVVPLDRELAIGTLRGILKQAGVAVEDFQANLA